MPGDPRLLCGVPIAIKDLLSATEGLPTTHGSAAFGDWVADHDAAHVRRLREAGAIIVAKSNTPELGMRPVTENARYGATRNPWNTGLSAGGSSGGSAAAVAAGMVGMADGSDLGGSLRIPGSCCGLVALKPSRGRVSIGPDFGLIGLGAPADAVLTRTVLDTATALDAIAGYEPGDHHFLPPPDVPFRVATQREPQPTRVMLSLSAPLGVPVDEQPIEAARHAADALARLGHDVGEATPDWDDEDFPASWGTVMTGTVQHRGPRDRAAARPCARCEQPRAGDAGMGRSVGAGDADRLPRGRRAPVGVLATLIRSWPPDAVLLTPTLTRLPAEIAALRSQAGVTDDAVRFSALVRIWNVTGQPAITVPLYETPEGVPVGSSSWGRPAATSW